jgi:2-dehydropantoate 2-reductase
MKFLFFGAGAIGTYIGGSLALAGYPVAFLEQPLPAERLRAEGLSLTIGPNCHRIPVREVYTDPAEALHGAGPGGAVDLAVFALKSYDTAAALESLQPLNGKLPPVLCLQNGVDNEPALEGVFGAGRVIAGTVTSAIGRAGSDTFVLERKRGVGIAAGHPLCVPLLQALNNAALNARLYPTALPMKWSKLLVNLISNASSAILGLTPREVFSNPRLFALEREMLRECLRVMHAARIPVADLPGTPVRLLALAAQNLPRFLAQPALVRAVGGGRGGKMPSFYLDLRSGRGKTEVEWLNGAVVRTGRQYVIPTPVNQLLMETLLNLAGGREEISSYLLKPEKLLSGLTRGASR